MFKKFAMATIFAISLTACSGTGNDAPTRLITQVTDGVDANLNSDGNLIYLRNFQVAVNEAGDATLIGTIVNQLDTRDALIALAINQMQIDLKPIDTPLNKAIIFGGESANVIATIPATDLVAGSRVPVSFFFGLGGTVSVDALVVQS